MSDQNTQNTEAQTETPDVTAISERGVGKKKIPGHIVINTKDNSNANWYVVHTTSGHEVRVAETLRQRVETMGLQDDIYEEKGKVKVLVSIFGRETPVELDLLQIAKV